MEDLKFQVGPESVGSYKRMNYSPWHAIAEFVDNATQSFFDNREALVEQFESQFEDKEQADNSEERPLKVYIRYDASRDYFEIEDNAMGMSEDELKRALHVAEPPPDPRGRSRYGMGLKTAAGWIGNYWTIRTKKLGESIEHFVAVDVEEIVNGNDTLHHEETAERPLDEHYTILRIEKHNRPFKGKTLNKIVTHLQSMYRQDFRNGDLELYWKDRKLEWTELTQDLLTRLDGTHYKQDFEFKIANERTNRPTRVWGWVGVLKNGSRQLAGFSQFHNNRIVKGYPDSWRPEPIYGEASNDLVNQRLVGEIHLDEFDVSHTKDKIEFYGDQEEEVERKLEEVCRELREVAKTYRKGADDSRGPRAADEEIAYAELRKELESAEMRTTTVLRVPLSKDLVKDVKAAVVESTVSATEETIKAKVGGLTVRLYVNADLAITEPYLSIDLVDKDELIVVVNKSHPHWKQLNGESAVLNYLRHCVYDGIGEWQAFAVYDDLHPDTVKWIKDRFLRVPMEMERHSRKGQNGQG